MNLAESFRFAWQGITANTSRSALTMLGVLIGVASVIMLVAFGTGASNGILSSINSLGANTLTVTPGSGGDDGNDGFGPADAEVADPAGRGTRTRAAILTMADAQALTDAELAPDVATVAPVVSAPGVTATYGGSSHALGATSGTTSAYLSINNDTVAAGRPFTDADYLSHARVVLLGPTVAENLAGGDGRGVLDQTIQLNGKSFTVIGILTAKGSNGPQDSDDRLLAPATAVQDTLAGYGSISSIAVTATSSDTVAVAQTQVEAILDTRHRTTPANRDYTIFSAAAFLDAAGTATTILTSLLAAVAGISLLVGGIGVMNIMLVTVTERTREIGLRKAIGAGEGVIITQFLLEAVLLSMMGGLAGVALGVGVGQITIAGVVPEVAPWSVAVSFGFSVAIGLVFGLYPARRAARLRPIEALRYE